MTDLCPEAVHCWLVALDAMTADQVDASRAVLDDRERQRADRLRIATARRQFILTRAAVRRILGQYLDVAPETIRFRYGSHGKPSVEGSLHFNVAHSHDRALIAVSHNRELGVDIEKQRHDIRVTELARRFFAPGEIAAVEQTPPADRPSTFLRCWTRKEALLKAHGAGISFGLNRFEAPLGDLPGQARGEAWVDRWTLHEAPACPGYICAIAVERGPVRVVGPCEL